MPACFLLCMALLMIGPDALLFAENPVPSPALI
jgi:hypothetical protein